MFSRIHLIFVRQNPAVRYGHQLLKFQNVGHVFENRYTQL